MTNPFGIEDEARERMVRLGLTEEQYDFCFDDWANWPEHLEWLLTATKQEIIDWIDASGALDEN